MKALVTARPQPHRIVDDDGNAEPYRWQLSVDDRVALEAALSVADEVTAVGIGGETARFCVRSALMRGADRGVLISFEPVERTVSEKYASVLARIAARESPDTLFIGQESSLAGSEIAGLAAAELDWPSVTRVTEFGRSNANITSESENGADELVVQRKLAIGRQEIVAASPPVVLGIDAGFANPERAPLDTVIAGQRADIECVDLDEVVPGESPFSMSVGATNIQAVTPNNRWGIGRPPREGTVEERIYRMLGRKNNERTSAGEQIDAPPAEAAERVVTFLQERGLL